MTKTLIIFSTITGNAFKLAEAAKEGLDSYAGPYNIDYIDDALLNEFDWFVFCYYCDKGTADPKTVEMIHKLQGKHIMIMGTLGASLKTPHARIVKENVAKLVSENNILVGNYLCRGSIDLYRTSKKLAIPEGQPRHLSIDRFLYQHDSLGHPNDLDLYEAMFCVRESFKSQQ